MKKLLFLWLLVISQVHFSQVSMTKNKLMKDGKTYRLKEYEQVFTNPTAKEYFKKSRANNTAATIFGFSGGVGLGLGFGRLLSGNTTIVNTNGTVTTVKKDNGSAWTWIGIGTGLVVVGIPFASATKKNANKAIEIENNGGTAFHPYFKLETLGNGIALSYNF